MAVFADILDWSADRHVWKQDALRRIIIQGDLSADDIDEIHKICLAQVGFDDPENPAPLPIPLTAEHIPDRGNGSKSVQLNWP